MRLAKMAAAILGVLLLIGVGWWAITDVGVSGEWQLEAIEVDGEPFDFGSDRATLKIATRGYWAFDGCNSWGWAPVSASRDGAIEFGSGDSTLIGCPEGNVNGAFSAAVRGADAWARNGDELILTGERSRAVFRLTSSVGLLNHLLS